MRTLFWSCFFFLAATVASTAAPIASGENQNGTIAAGGVDSWTFSVAIGDTILARAGETAGGNNFSPTLRLLGPTSTQITSDSHATDAFVFHRATASGTYTVTVAGASGTQAGSYRLRFYKIPDNFVVPSGDEGGALTNGGTHDGTIEVGDLDAYTIQANINDHLIFRLGKLTGENNFTPEIVLYGPNGAQITYDYHASDAAIFHRATSSGTYTLVVTSWVAGNAGTYRLRAQKIPGTFTVPVGDEGGALINGGNHDGTIDVGDFDAWTIQANINDHMIFRLGELTGENNFTPEIVLYGPDGAQITYDYHATDAKIFHRATSSGTYTLVVTSWVAGNSGTYRLRAQRVQADFLVPVGDEGGPLTNGGSHDGTIAVGDLDAWTIQASANDHLIFRLGKLSGENNFTPEIVLYGPNGAQITYDYHASDVAIYHRATASGIYTLVVTAWVAGNSGTYRLQAQKVPGTFVVPTGDQGGPLTNGGEHDGTIDVGDFDAWTIQANINDHLIFRLGELSGENNFTPEIVLYGPDGAQITYDYQANDAVIYHRATSTGPYTLVVTSWVAGNSGTYRLRAQKITGDFIIPNGDQGGPLTNGGNHDGTIALGDFDAWTFQANINDTMLFRLGELSGENNFTPEIVLYGPNGAQITYDYHANDASIAYRATASGIHTLVVTSWVAGNSGTYRLHALKVTGNFIVPAGDDGGVLSGGQTVDGAIALGDIDAWAIAATVGTPISLSLTELTGENNFNPYIAIIGPTGAVLTSSFNASAVTLNYTPVTTGIHTVVVEGYAQGNVGTYRLTGTGFTAPAAPAITAFAASQSVALNGSITLTPTITGTAPLLYQWRKNGVDIAGATTASYPINNAQPSVAGIYSLSVTNSLGTVVSNGTIVGIDSQAKVVGAAYEFAGNITHLNGNVYDQILLTGTAATITADPGQIVRTSCVDLNDDIVQIEFSGPGSLTINLASATGPAIAVKYNQPTVQYMKGHISLTLIGANENTHLSVFTVGSFTAVNQALFPPGTVYDGVADIALLAVSSPTNRLGSIRFANTELFNATGFTGVYAPGVRVGGPANIHNISASNTATSLLVTGTIDTGRIGITGGDMLQPNGSRIQVGDAQAIFMLDGATSHNVPLPAQPNRGVYERNGVIVTF